MLKLEPVFLNTKEKQNVLLQNLENEEEESTQPDILSQVVNYTQSPLPLSPTQMNQINVKQNIVQNVGSNTATN